MFKNLVLKEITSLRLKLKKCQRISSDNGILIQNLKKQEKNLISIKNRIKNQSNVEELDSFEDGIQSKEVHVRFLQKKRHRRLFSNG